MSLPLKLTQKLHLVQNSMAQVLPGAWQRMQIMPILQLLHWSVIGYRVLAITYKALHLYLQNCPLLLYPATIALLI